jgi:phenylpropionate dioxygenase-like ring-hydroxylating dioxygenase large terminal subunit
MHNQQKNSEMELGKKLFNEYWHMVCHRQELPNSNDFLKFKTPIGDVVIFNDNGEYVAFDNRCAHRGTMIYEEDYGNQPNTCKYHGWTYRNGKLSIPGVENFAACNIESADIKKYQLDWCGDFMFLGITPKMDLYSQLDGVATYIENISFNIERRQDLSSYEYECYWPLALENALEPYHIDMVHPNTLATLSLEDGVNQFYGCNSIWMAPVGNEKVKKQLMSLNRFFNIDFQYEGYMSIYLFPFTMISSTYGFSYSLQNFFPSTKGCEKTNFMSRLLTANLKDESSKKVTQFFFDSSAAVNRQVFEEDHSICKLMPMDSWSTEPLLYISMQEEKILHFRMQCANVSKSPIGN